MYQTPASLAMSYRGAVMLRIKEKCRNTHNHRIPFFLMAAKVYSQTIVTLVYCHSGARSSAAVAVHKSTGNDDVKTIDGIRDYKGPSERGDKS